MFQLILGAALLGFAPIFVKLVALGPTPIAMYRCGLGALFLFALARRIPLSWPPKLFGYIVLAGVLFAADLFVWHRSVIYAGAGLGTILANTQVFYVTLAGILFFGEKLTFRFLSAVAMAFVGTYLLIRFRPFGFAVGDRYLEGVLYGLGTGVVYSGYVLALRQVQKYSKGYSATAYLTLASAVTALCLLPVSWAEGTLRLPTGIELVWLVLLAAIAQVIAWLLISRNIGRFPVSRTGLILIMQPLVATIAGAAIFGETFHPLQWLGAALVLIALYLGTSRGPSAGKA